MATLTCEICGGKLKKDDSGDFICENCGLEYTGESLKARFQKISGTVKVEGSVQVEGSATAESLIRRGFIELESGQWKKSRELFDKALDSEPENGEAYLGILMSKFECHTEKELAGKVIADTHSKLVLSDEYKKCHKFAKGYILEKFTSWENSRNEKIAEEYVALRAQFKTNCQKLTELGVQKKSISQNNIKKRESLSRDVTNLNNRIEALLSEIADITNDPKLKDIDEQIKKVSDQIRSLGIFKKKEKLELSDTLNKLQCEKNTLISEIDCKKACKQVELYDCNYSLKNAIEKEKNFLSDAIQEEKSILRQISSIQLKFGKYPQPIEWRTIDIIENKALLISEYALDCQPYNTEWENVTWESCSLRKWLNSTFLDNAFNAEEQAQIQYTKVSADKNPEYNTDPGTATTDKVYLLSVDEANKYFDGDDARCCVPTDYAVANGAYKYIDEELNEVWWTWWLRSPGDSQESAAIVACGGVIIDYPVDDNGSCVRPAMWINLES